MNVRSANERVLAMVACLVAIGAGLACRYGLSGMAAKYVGVALWSTEVYAIARVVRPFARVSRVAIVTLAVSWGVEFAQLTPVPVWLSSQHVVLRLVFGTTFSVLDLPAYAAGVGLAAAIHAATRRMRCARVRTLPLDP